MSLDAWRESKERVREAIDIVDLVGHYVQLRRQGRMYVGLCPWHDDSRPSLQVNPQRQSFKCYVCDIGGDIFAFTMRQEGVEFRQALELLAERAGISLQAAQPRKPIEPGSPDDKRALYQAMAWAEQQFHECLLHSEEAAPARRYLSDRGISTDSIARFHLGFSPPAWDWLLSRARKSPHSPAVLERVGLIIPRQSGQGFYDRFRGRVLFSIRDTQSRPIALGGRILPDAGQEGAKYINSPETPLFSKNQQLYGLDVARDAVSKQRNAVVVEGYTDCVTAHQFGWHNVVAVLGTALGQEHIKLLRRFADSVTLVLDGDEAGQRRANEILELFVAAQADLRILTLPRNLDPCDFLREHGSEAFGRLVAGAVDALQHKINTVTKGLDLTADTHQAHAALDSVLGTLARAPRSAASTPASVRLREHQIVSRLSRQFGPPEDELRRRLAELRSRGRRSEQTSEAQSRAAEPPQPADLWDRMVLETVVGRPEALAEIAAVVRPEDLRSPQCRALYARCLELSSAGRTANFDGLMLELEDPRLKHLLVQVEEAQAANSSADLDQAVREIMANFLRRKEEHEHRRLMAALRADDSLQKEEALDDLIASLKSRQDRSKPTEG